MKRSASIGLALALNLFLALPGAASVAPPRNPNSAKGCAICHFRWIDAFFVEGRGTDLVDYQKEKVVASRRMCISCHDGGVKDSRAKLIDHSGHKINQPPPAGYDIPDIFPLDDKGNLQCATCHTAHGVPSGPDSEETIFMRTSNKDSAMCRMCHPHRDGGLSAGNHPDDARAKAVPPDLSRAGARTSSRGGGMVCETCHTAHGSTFRGFTVQNAGNARLCITCHPDKDIFDPDGARRPFHAINVAPVNARIPAALFEKGAKLGDQGLITCLTCHNIHLNRSRAEHLLVIPQGEKSTFCFTCHPNKAGIANGRHNMARSRPMEKNLEGRTVAQAGVCSACHLPHKAARDLPSGDNLTTRLCLSCHGQARIAEKANLAGRTHPLTVNPFQVKIQRSELPTVVIEPDSLELPLFNRSGVQAGSGLMTCSTCHDTHGPRNGASQHSPPSSKAIAGTLPSVPQQQILHLRFQARS
jgi:predicted CXXCH cytochrome family protein